MPGLKTHETDHRSNLFSDIRQLLLRHSSVQCIVVCGSYAHNEQKYFGATQVNINSDLDAVIVSPNRRAAKRFRKDLYARLMRLGIRASASTRLSYNDFRDGIRSVSLYEYDEINSGIVILRVPTAIERTPKAEFALNAVITIPTSELVMLVINRYFELMDTVGNGSDRAQKKLDAAVRSLAERLGLDDVFEPASLIQFAAENNENLKFDGRYFNWKRRVLWALRTRRILGHPVNTLHIYNNCIQACILDQPLERVVHTALDEWRKGTA